MLGRVSGTTCKGPRDPGDRGPLELWQSGHGGQSQRTGKI